MQEIIEKLKASYDSKTLGEIEEEAQDTNSVTLAMRELFVKILYYLNFTKRYREDKRFRRASFAEYLKERWNINYESFRLEANALFNYPEESKKFGIGTIAKIIKRSKGVGIGNVLSVIQKEEKRKKKNLSAGEINHVIEAHFPAIKPARPAGSCAQCEKYVARIKELTEENARLESQVNKLKMALAREQGKNKTIRIGKTAGELSRLSEQG